MNTNKISLTSNSIIGFFDSGIGGLTVLQRFVSLPIAHCIYVADTANMPYGNKSLAAIQEYSEHIVRFLLMQEANIIIISCHTATALALQHLQTIFKNKIIIGVVDLVAREAAKSTKNNRIGIIATQATIKSGAHKKALMNYNSHAIVIEQACPLLASAVEFGTHKGKELDTLVLGYIQPLLDAHIDTLILGSTHYDVIKHVIQRITNNMLTLVSAHDLILEQFMVPAPNAHKHAQFDYYVSGNLPAFFDTAQTILTIDHNQIKKLSF